MDGGEHASWKQREAKSEMKFNEMKKFLIELISKG